MTLLSLPEGLNLLDRRTRFARIALLAYIFVSALDILVAMGQFTGAIDNEDMSLPTAGALTIIFLLYLLIFAATVVLVAMWVYRAPDGIGLVARADHGGNKRGPARRDTRGPGLRLINPRRS